MQDRARPLGAKMKQELPHGHLHKISVTPVENYKAPSVYLFSADLHGLSSATIPPSLEWMIIVCYHRGMIKEYDGQWLFLDW